MKKDLKLKPLKHVKTTNSHHPKLKKGIACAKIREMLGGGLDRDAGATLGIRGSAPFGRHIADNVKVP